MEEPHLTASARNKAPLGFVEFVSLVAAMMALTALGIDSMLPALPAIGASLGVDEPNHRQYVITAFLIGFAFAQLIYGPLSDRYGRRPVLVIALALYVATSVLAAASGSFTLLLIARAAMGASAAGARVVSIALVRDCFAGRAMARVMSLAVIVFMAAPIFAPSLGQLVLFVGAWRLIFWMVALIAALVLTWFWLRMPETLAQDARLSLNPGRVLSDYGLMLRDRQAVGYTIGVTLLSGGLFGFIGSVQQVMEEVFHAPGLLAVVFPCVASTMALASFANSWLVMKIGMRRISHTALVGMIGFAALHLVLAWFGYEALWSFILLQALMMGCVSLSTSNFSALAMEKMGEIAGTAASLQGFVSTLGSALIGAAIGQSFNGTTVPIYAGFLLMGVLSFVVVALTERGRMFRPS
ncbi:multidrug effflux MFS transporter [Sphingomonas sp. HITSZ_GF]|uniref:multidrug effflux MFS transporter n=1 Tax=Sphingomonas sp. HITSZ_GF TaxID=3037247 RepID=UPI00240CFE76|nr:multidrug effflux MFS transporter [Sphingomonas sp. HITSZ_GF]MDG2533280.1 multidrug effflux MFS transporter [Sphingomonas sp. HITSZ_GF]